MAGCDYGRRGTLQRLADRDASGKRMTRFTNCPIGFRATSYLQQRRNGAKRARTADLLGAIQALSQLSYSPGTPDLTKLVRALGRSQGAVVEPSEPTLLFSPPRDDFEPVPPEARPESVLTPPVTAPIESWRFSFFFVGVTVGDVDGVGD
jgi:hypothetical protein